MYIFKLITRLLIHNVERPKIHRSPILKYYSEPQIIFIPARQITGILDADKQFFWQHHGQGMEDYISLAQRSTILYKKWLLGTPIDKLSLDPECTEIAKAYLTEHEMVQVIRKNANEYEWANDGRHRTAAAQRLDIHILVRVIGEYEPEQTES